MTPEEAIAADRVKPYLEILNNKFYSYQEALGCIPWVAVLPKGAQCWHYKRRFGRRVQCKSKAKYLYVFINGNTSILCHNHFTSWGLYKNDEEVKRYSQWASKVGART